MVLTDLNWGWWVAPTGVTVLCLYFWYLVTGRYAQGRNQTAVKALVIDETAALGMFAAIAWVVWAVLA